MPANVRFLVERGDQLSIEDGVLTIRPASGKPVSRAWLNEHGSELTIEILNALGLQAYEFDQYSTGYYTKHKKGGVNLQFLSVSTGERAYTIFNIELTRQRNTKFGKQGEALPKNHFTVRKGSGFLQFWLRAGLPKPRNLSKVYECMGKLRRIMFIAPQLGERLDKHQLCPLQVPASAIRQAFLTSNEPLTASLDPARHPLSASPKEYQPAQVPRVAEASFTTGIEHYGNKVISMRGYTDKQTIINKPPSEQSVEEWLDDLDAPDPHPFNGMNRSNGETQ